MRVELDGGEVISLGDTETTPTIGITDYSRRVTDDFGITTVVERGFARRMSVRFALPTDAVDTAQRRFAALRATPALWVASDDIASLAIRGFYKDFSLDIPGPSVSFCTLTVEGLTETAAAIDPGGDPAPAGQASTLQLLQPDPVTDAVLTASSAAEDEYPAWSAGTTYPQGARVIRTHRIYESLAGGNVGNDPTAAPDKWLDAAPTNRWAMFDQALGTVTTGTGQITLTLTPATAVTGLSILDTDAGLIRVQAPGYDRTQLRGGDHPEVASVLFLDLVAAAGAPITVTIGAGGAAGTPRIWNDAATWVDAATWQDFNTAAGTGPVSVGTLLLGKVVGLGVTEASPSAGITDYSRKEVDDFGEATIVERAWAKRMSARALIRSDAVDAVAARITAARARPSLWIGQNGLDCLTIYGFFKDFAIEAGPSVSTLSLSIEGLSKASPVTTGGLGSVSWPDVTDPTGTKPTDNADVTGDNTSKDTNAVGGKPASAVLAEAVAAKLRQDTFEQQTLPAINAAAAAAGLRIFDAEGLAGVAKTKADQALANIISEATRLDTRIDNVSSSGGYDDTAVYAEVSRVDSTALGRDVALGTRVDTVTASIQTTDTDLRALVSTKETAAVDRETAISQRVDTLIAQGGGGSSSVDTVARSEVSRVEQASIGRDTALGTRIDTTTASIGPAINAKAAELTTAFTQAETALAQKQLTLEATSRADPRMLNRNATFSDWPDAQYLPSRFAGSTAPNSISRVPGKIGRWAMRQVYGPGQGAPNTYVAATGDAIVWNFDTPMVWDSSLNIGAGKFVLEADVELETGQLVGAGVFVAGYDAEIVARSTGLLDFASDPDNSGTAQDVGMPGRRYKFSKLVDLADPRIRFLRLHPITASTILDRGYSPYKTLVWHFVGVRPATDLEIKAGKADAALPALIARVAATETATTDGRFATAQRAGTIEVTAGQLAARVATTETATTDGRFAAASTVTQLRSEYNGTAATVTQQAGTIVGLGQRTAAFWQVEALAGNGRALLRVVADANNGGGVDIGGDLRVSGLALFDRLSNLAGTVVYYLDTGIQTIVAAGYRKVSGAAFGVNSDLMEWWGPDSIARGQESKANALWALAIDGSIVQGAAPTGAGAAPGASGVTPRSGRMGDTLVGVFVRAGAVVPFNARRTVAQHRGPDGNQGELSYTTVMVSPSGQAAWTVIGQASISLGYNQPGTGAVSGNWTNTGGDNVFDFISSSDVIGPAPGNAANYFIVGNA